MRPRLLVSVNQRFGRLVVLNETERGSQGHIRFQCICDCGKLSIVTASNLVHEETQSCGCLARETASLRGRANELVKVEVGETFGRLQVIREGASRRGGYRCWMVRCSCGVEKEVDSHNLRSGHTVSCGCWRSEASAINGKKFSTTHGHAKSDGQASPTYRSYQAMLQRCTNANAPNYALYGGAGVRVCEGWMKFENFLADMGLRPEGTSLSRFGDIGDYEPGNCAWHTWTQQTAEARTKRLSKTMSVSEMAVAA